MTETVNPDPKVYPPIKTRIYSAYVAIVQIIVPSYGENKDTIK